MSVEATWHPVASTDGHRWQVLAVRGDAVRRGLVWIPALGVPARTYEAFGRALAARGVAVVIHEWRGLGSSSVRASRSVDWAYRELLGLDIPATREFAADWLREVQQTIGGHSLGGQLATCSLALQPRRQQELWLVASGAPYWKVFPSPTRYGLPAAYRLLRGLASGFGALPGRRLGFGGTEARGVMRDWSHTGLTGRYEAPVVGDMEPALREVHVPVRGVLLSSDWLAPRRSLDFLIAKTSPISVTVHELDSARLGAHADHFSWMRTPGAVVDALLSSDGLS